MDGQLRYQTEADLLEKAVHATRIFIERDGSEVVETGFQTVSGGIDVVSRDECGTLHFTWVRVRKYGLPEPVDDYGKLRTFFEHRAMAWLEAHPEATNCMLSFDVSDLGVIARDRAILRYHRGVLETPCNCNELRVRGEMRALGIPVDDDADDEPAETLAEDLAAAETDAE